MGEGTVYKRSSDGRWVAKWTDRRGVQRTIYRRTRTEARRALRDALEERDHGAGSTDPSVKAWCDWWVDQVDVRPTTRDDYRYKLGLLPDWLVAERLSDLTPMDVHQALDDIATTPTAAGKPRAGSTVAQVRSVLGSALADAQRYGHVNRNAARLTRPPRQTPTDIVPLEVDEASKLLAALAERRNYSLYLTAITTGLRQSECVGLRWDDVELDTGRLTVGRQITRTNKGVKVEGPPKTSRSARQIALPALTVAALRRHRVSQAKERLLLPGWVDQGLVWSTRNGTPLGHRNILRELHRACEDAGIRKVSFHTLRHSAATILLAAGVPDRVIIDVLGHSDARQLVRYAHVGDSLRQAAADAMDAVGVKLGVSSEVKR